MLKKTITLALAALAVLAVSAPAASASWYKHHQVIQTDQQLTLTGQFRVQNLAIGTIECQTHAKVKLLLGQTTARIEEFKLDLPQNPATTPTKVCKTEGALSTCKVTSFTSDASTEKPWLAHLQQNKDTIDITSGNIAYHLEGPDSTENTHTACGITPEIKLLPANGAEGHTVHATVVGNTCTISQLTLSGQLTTGTGAKAQVSGTQNVTPAATYGTLCP